MGSLHAVTDNSLGALKYRNLSSATLNRLGALKEPLQVSCQQSQDAGVSPCIQQADKLTLLITRLRLMTFRLLQMLWNAKDEYTYPTIVKRIKGKADQSPWHEQVRSSCTVNLRSDESFNITLSVNYNFRYSLQNYRYCPNSRSSLSPLSTGISDTD